MPIYLFSCEQCNKYSVEVLRPLIGMDDPALCENCGLEMIRQLSIPNTVTADSMVAPATSSNTKNSEHRIQPVQSSESNQRPQVILKNITVDNAYGVACVSDNIDLKVSNVKYSNVKVPFSVIKSSK
jgi:putative FmdB family regulatory protein